MTLERTAGTSNIIDILDRVLDKGVVIDAWVRVSVVGIEVVTVEARVVVASIATYLAHAETLADIRAIPQASSVVVPRELQSPASLFGVNGQRNRERSRIAAS
jgi:hypothetical protein